MLWICYEILSINIGKNIGNMVTMGAYRPHSLGPFSVLHAAAMFLACVFLRKLDGAIVAKPANMLEGTPGRFLHGLNPALQGFDIGWVILCNGKAGNQ